MRSPANQVLEGTNELPSTNELYYPGHFTEWETRQPEDVGMDSTVVRQAIDFAIKNETEAPKDLVLERTLNVFEPHDDLIGPIGERGACNGVILRHGYIMAEWGETDRVDTTFSATKSYVSTCAGLAFDRGLIRDLNHKVGLYVRDGGFDSPHNSQITWHQMLNQTSDWEGTLWGKPDWADRPEGPYGELPYRKRNAPGTVWKYNDVRVNRLALSLLRIWRKPLPQVLKELIMDPIGASPTWQWHGYENSWVKIDGVMMQSVAGGGHWGGGMQISSRDHARFGLLCLRDGRWKGQQLLSEEWIGRATTPTGTRITDQYPLKARNSIPAENQTWYGYMNWMLNTGRQLLPSCPETCYMHEGNGANVVWVDNEHDLVVVVRWINRDRLDDFLGKVIAAVK